MATNGGGIASHVRDRAGYWSEATRPLVSLVFVAPMLMAYEAGLWLLGPYALRNGADVWLRGFLEGLGFSQYLLLPFVTCAILLGWHHINREPWRVDWTTLYGMLFESSALGVLLLLLARAQRAMVGEMIPQEQFAFTGEAHGAGRIVAYLGAGIYEELLFRLVLLPILYGVLRVTGASRQFSFIAAITVGSLLFAAAHYRIDLQLGGYRFQTACGESFDAASFAFRTSAGVFFSLLFVHRGFGVAAGTHALYDILVGQW